MGPARRANMKLLLVEDDAMIGETVRIGLAREGFEADWLRDGAAARTALAIHDYDAVLLDLGLPGIDGLDLLQGLRRLPEPRGQVPVLVITARDAVADRVRGLDAGADDYLVKPFALDELAARVRALVRRGHGRSTGTLEYGDLLFDPSSRALTVAGQPVSLSARELAVFEALSARPGVVLSRVQLEERVYGWGERIDSNAIEVHIHALRRKIGAHHIRTIRGVGYVLAE